MDNRIDSSVLPPVVPNVLQVIPKRGKKYENEEDRRKGYLASQLRYATKLWRCEICNISLMKGNKTAHLKSKTHQKQFHHSYRSIIIN